MAILRSNKTIEKPAVGVEICNTGISNRQISIDAPQGKIKCCCVRDSMKSKKAIPKGLSNPEAVAFYNKITDKCQLTYAGLQLLTVAAYTLERMLEAKAILDNEGLCQGGQAMNRLHPAAKAEHDSRLSFCRIVKELNLDSELENLP